MRDRSHASMTQTNWDLIRDAASGSETARASLDAVMKRAWPAVYAFIRASGRKSEEATELTQAFICDVFLARRLLEKADQARGRFRTLLLGAVRNYLADVHRRRTATTRMPKSGLIAIDAAGEYGMDVADDATGDSPERAFNARYVAGLVRTAGERLHRELQADGDAAGWELFRTRVLQAAFQGDAPGYDTLAPRLGLERGQCAAKLLVVKRRFSVLLMEELRATVSDPDAVREEVDDLLALLKAR